MRNNLLKFGIRGKLFLMASLFVLFVVFVVSFFIFQQFNTLKKNDTFGDIFGLTSRMSEYIHETQKERGMTAVLVAIDGKQYQSELSEQRKAVDLASAKLDKFIAEFNEENYGTGFVVLFNRALEIKSELDSHRKKVMAGGVNDSEAIDYYSRLNAGLLDVVHHIVVTSPSVEISRQMGAYVAFMEGKEKVGRERALTIELMGDGVLTEDDLVKIGGLRKLQDGYFDAFSWYANERQINLYEEKLSSQAFANVEDIRDSIFNPEELTLLRQNTTVDRWWEAMTAKIDIFREVEISLESDLLFESARLYDEIKTNIYTSIVIALASILVAVLVGFFLARSITAPVKNLTDAVNDISKGKLDVKLNNALLDSQDEIGDLARAFDRTVVSLKLAMRKKDRSNS